MSVFGECAILNDGRKVITPWNATGVFVGDVFFPGPQLRLPDACLDTLARVWVAASHQHENQVSVWLQAKGIWWPCPQPPFGSRVILRAAGVGVQVAFTTNASNWICYSVTDGGVMALVSTGTIPDGSGANGMRDWDPAGTPRPMSPLDQPLLGHQVRGALTSGITTIAQGLAPLPDQMVLARGGVLGTLMDGGSDAYRLSANALYWAGVRYQGEGLVGGSVPSVVPPLHTSPPPVIPPVIPPVKPPDPPHPQPPDPPKPPMPQTRTVGFLTWIKKFVTAEDDPSDVGLLNAVDRPGTPTPPQRVGPWETMTLEPHGDNVLIRTEGGRYWKAEHANTTTAMDPTAWVTSHETNPNTNPDSWELFHYIDNGDGTVSLKSQFGFYVSCQPNGDMLCNRTAIGLYEQFILLPPGSGVPQQPEPIEPGTSMAAVHPDGHIFRLADGTPWRYKGVTAFRLCQLWLEQGVDAVKAFLNAYPGYNTVRVFSYVEGPNWTDPTWNEPTPDQAVEFAKLLNSLGWRMEWVAKTSSNTGRNQRANDIINGFAAAHLTNIFLEGANEPEVQNPDSTFIDCGPIKSSMQASGFPYTNGCYTEGGKRWWGTYITCHTQRDSEWPRRSHDAYDLWVKPADAPAGAQAVHAPCLLDEPAKVEDVGFSTTDWKAYFGSGAAFAAGVTFHSKTGKFAQLPTDQERQLAAAGLVGLNAYPSDAPANFDYQRIDDATLRTYRMGNVLTRIRPTTPNPPQSGWTSLDTDHILYTR